MNSPTSHTLRSLATDDRGVDEIDRAVDEDLPADPYNGDPPSRRSDKDIGKLLDLLDSLDDRGNG